MLIALPEQSDRQKIVDEIIDKQFIGNSDTNVVDDARSIANIFFEYGEKHVEKKKKTN
jgi:hypothetical protein